MTAPEVLARNFAAAAAKARIEGWPCPVRTETLPVSHSRPFLPPGQSAVNVFVISEAHGRSAPGGRPAEE